jgi:F420-non-reducing hydrogenase iron-sulfur subunit
MEGECHYLEGNFRAKSRVGHMKQLLEEVGLEPERVEMFNIASSEGPKFAQIVIDMTERIKALGPNPIKLKAKEKQEEKEE